MKFSRQPQLTTRQEVIDALPGTAQQIAERVGKGLSTIKSHLLSMRRGKVFICHWEAGHTSHAVAVYQYGKGTDAVRPPVRRKIRDRSPDRDYLSQAAGCVLPDIREPMVQFAARTQPNSVFSLAGSRV